MCGLCGYVGDHRPELLEAMCATMTHRGPDDVGTWSDADARVGLGHRRLSIIDLSAAGRQPMCNEDGTIWVAFNGEIYNFRELRKDLLDRGHQFRSQTDTEVILHLYEEKGSDFLSDLNGMFAIALWDGNQRGLLLARDHAGIKPLYYYGDGDRLFFASEIKALLQVPDIPRNLNHHAVPQYLTFLWVPGQETMLRDIHKLEPGHSLWWRDGKVEIKQWFSLSYEPDESVEEAEWVERVHDTFIRVTQRQMVSDVPLGAFLSGGADSSSIVASMRQAYPGRRIKCYTIRFREGDMARDQFVDDYPYAKKVAQSLDVDLESILLKPDSVSLLPKMIYHLDEPDADPAVFPNYFISKLAREDGTTVLLSGTGGDEVFFGYRSHQAYRQYENLGWIPRWMAGPTLSSASTLTGFLLGAQHRVPRRLRKFRRGFMNRGLDRHLALSDWSDPLTRQSLFSNTLLEQIEGAKTPPACMQKYFDRFSGTGEINRHSHVLIQTFLGAHNFLYTDKSSMAASIEVRVPFMDVELMSLCARIPERYKLKGQVTKHLLKKSMERYLPNDILYRSKTGFGAPLRQWIAQDLKPVIHDLLGRRRIEERGLFDPQAVERVLSVNQSNKADHAYLIYSLLNLEIWMQTFIDRPGCEVSL